jgi:hypothetical protein
MAGFIEQPRWKDFLNDFSKRNQFRPTRLEVAGGSEIGVHEEEKFLPLVGVSFEPKGSETGSVVVTMGGETIKDARQVEHLVEHVQRIAPLIGDLGEQGLGFEDREGTKTLLIFEVLREIPETTTRPAERTSTRH